MPARRTLVRIDLGSPGFQSQLRRIDDVELTKLERQLERIARMTWNDLYRSPGLKWEKIGARPGLGNIYTFRITQKSRAVACRQGDHLRLISLHPDHDSDE